MEIAGLLIFAGALLVAAGSPGPNVAALVSRVLTRGPRDVLPFLTAMWIGEAIWLAFAVWGLSAIAQSFQLAFLVIKWLGVGYLLFLAWQMWNAPSDLHRRNVSDRTSSGKLFAAGLAVTLGNPKIMMFYMALLPTIIDLNDVTLLGWVELTVAMVLVLIVVDAAWVFFAARARRLLTSPKAVRIANRCSAGIMAGAASAIASR